MEEDQKELINLKIFKNKHNEHNRNEKSFAFDKKYHVNNNSSKPKNNLVKRNFYICLLLTSSYVVCFMFLSIVMGVVIIQDLTENLYRDRICNSAIVSSVSQTLREPKTMAKSLKPLIKGEFFDFETIEYQKLFDLVYLLIKDVSPYLGLSNVIIFISNSKADKFVSMWARESGKVELYRRFSPLDNTVDESIIGTCEIDSLSGDCVSNVIYVPWDKNSSITHTSRYYFEDSMVPPYLFFCPSDICDIFLSFTCPYHNNGNYIGTIGFAFPSNTIRKVHIDAVKSRKDRFGYIFDLQTGKMISISEQDQPLFETVDDITNQISAVDHSDQRISSTTKHIINAHKGNLNNMMLNSCYQIVFGTSVLNYMRFNEDGADWVFVVLDPLVNYIRMLLIFLAIFIAMIVLYPATCVVWIYNKQLENGGKYVVRKLYQDLPCCC